MYERILKQMREKIRTRQYVMTLHAEEEMAHLEGKGICPPRWHHVPNCRCEPDEFTLEGKGKLRESRARIEPEEILSEIDRILERMQQLFRRFHESWGERD